MSLARRLRRSWIVQRAGWNVGLAVLAALGAALLVTPGLRQDYRLEAFVASDDDTYAQLEAFLAEFPSSEYALIAIHSPAGNTTQLEEAATELTERLRSIRAVQEARSLTDLPAWLRTALGSRLRQHPLIAGNLISADGRTYAVLGAMAGETQGGASRKATVALLRQLVAEAHRSWPQLQLVLTGPYVTLLDMYSYVDRDLLVFSILAFVLSAACLALLFGRWSPMAYAAAAATAAILVTLGAAAALGLVTSLITQMLVILIVVLTLANAVHLAIAAEENHVEHPAAAPAPTACRTLRRMMVPCTAAMLTTAVGFGSVGISELAPVRRFGLLMCFGLMMGLLAGLVGAVPLHWRPSVPKGFVRVTAGLDRVALLVLHRPKQVIGAFLIGWLVIVAGATRLRSESDFVQNFREDSSVRRGYAFLTEHLTPLGAVEVLVRRIDGTPVGSPDELRRAAAVGAAAVAELPMVHKALSLADVYTLAGEGIPNSEAELLLRRAALTATSAGRQSLQGVVNQAGDTLRIHLRCAEGHPVEEKLAACARLEEIAAAQFGPAYEVRVTGVYAFYAHVVAGLIRDQYRALGLTIGLIFVALWIALRGLRLAGLALLVNLLPVAACLGVMGWVGTPVTMTTAIVLSVTLGIAVDSTVHYLVRLRRERRRLPFEEALRAAHRSTGRACVFTTIVIACGFSILMLSPFLPTAHFGGLLGLTILVGLAAGIVLMPAILVLMERAERRDVTRSVPAARAAVEPRA
jgi:predicted RND superfamily exporter protein